MYSFAEDLNNLLQSREKRRRERKNMTENDLLSSKLGGRTDRVMEKEKRRERKDGCDAGSMDDDR